MAKSRGPKLKATNARPKQYGAGAQQPASGLPSVPDATAVGDFHTNADTDVQTTSKHHTLGSQPAQASPGDHTHDGGTSAQLLGGISLTGARNSDAYLLSINEALVQLGARDNTTAT